MAVQAVQTCRWATPTIFLPWPLWYDAANFEWSCTRSGKPRGIDTPEACASCAGWAAAEERHAASCRCHDCHQDDHLGSIAP